MLRDLDSDIGLGAVIAALAPHNEPDVPASAWPKVIGSDSPLLRRVAIFRSMPLPNLPDEEYATAGGGGAVLCRRSYKLSISFTG